NRALAPRGEAPAPLLVVDDESAHPTPSSVLVLTLFHPLMDARGGENLLTHLNELDRHIDATPWGDSPTAFVSERDRRSLLQRSRVARSSLEYLRTLAPVPPVSAGGLPPPPGPAGLRP